MLFLKNERCQERSPDRRSAAQTTLPLADVLRRAARKPHRLTMQVRGRNRTILGRDKWCPGAGSNHRHCDFQSHALPTELPGRRPELCPGRAPVYREPEPPCPATGAISPRPPFRCAGEQNFIGFKSFRSPQKNAGEPIWARPCRPRRRFPALESHKSPTASG